MLNATFTISKHTEIHNGLEFLFYVKQDENKETSLMYKQDQLHHYSKNQQHSRLDVWKLCLK